jgi:hypothetical protein
LTLLEIVKLISTYICPSPPSPRLVKSNKLIILLWIKIIIGSSTKKLLLLDKKILLDPREEEAKRMGKGEGGEGVLEEDMAKKNTNTQLYVA